MEQDPTRICELLVGLGDVDVVGVDDEATEPLVVHIQTRSRPVRGGCGGLVWSKGASAVRLVDLPAFGRAVRLVWRKWRWRCPAAGCGVASFTETNDEIAPVRSALTTRAGRWATTAVGRDAPGPHDRRSLRTGPNCAKIQTQKVPPVVETNVHIDITIVADQEAFFADADTPTHPPQRWIQA